MDFFCSLWPFNVSVPLLLILSSLYYTFHYPCSSCVIQLCLMTLVSYNQLVTNPFLQSWSRISNCMLAISPWRIPYLEMNSPSLPFKLASLQNLPPQLLTRSPTQTSCHQLHSSLPVSFPYSANPQVLLILPTKCLHLSLLLSLLPLP